MGGMIGRIGPLNGSPRGMAPLARRLPTGITNDDVIKYKSYELCHELSASHGCGEVVSRRYIHGRGAGWGVRSSKDSGGWKTKKT